MVAFEPAERGGLWEKRSESRQGREEIVVRALPHAVSAEL